MARIYWTPKRSEFLKPENKRSESQESGIELI
jgi:hypothetical protein